MTGHYAQIKRISERYILKKAADKNKDQSYMLYTMTQEQLSHTLFPLDGVCKKDMAANTMTVAPKETLYTNVLTASCLNWIFIDSLTSTRRIFAKIHYRQKEQPATIYPEGNQTGRVVFNQAQYAVTPGQSIVFYEGEYVVEAVSFYKLLHIFNRSTENTT